MNPKLDISTYVLTLITVIVGWLLNHLSMRFASKRTQELEKKKILLTKIEELANLVDEIVKSYRNIWGEIVANLSIGKQVSVEGINLPFAKIQILINFYFPQLKPEYEILVKETDSFGRKIFPVLDERDEKKRGGLFVDLTAVHQRINVACERICVLSSKIAQDIM